jgi:ankyrin repeat protein
MTNRASWLAGLVALLPSVCVVAGQTPAPPPSPPAPKPPTVEVSIHEAAMNGDLAAVKKLLERNPALLEARDEDEGVTPLAYAAGFGRVEVLEFLVARGANVNARDPRGLSALLLTVYTGQMQALRFLLDKGADVKSPGPSGMSPLHFAVREGAEIAGLLVERKADVGARNDYGNTVLILAVREGAQDVVRLLVESGANVNTANPLTGDGPLEVALQEGHTGIADYLRAKGAKPRADAPKLLRGPYLGQTPPGATPVVFALNVVSTEGGELNSVFSPDGHEFYFTRQRRVWVVGEENGVWGRPQRLAVVGDHSTVDVFVTGDGKRMYLCSDRPLAGQGEPKKDRDIWVVTRTAQGWSDPTNLGETVNSPKDDLYPALTSGGDLYLCSRREGGKGRHDIYRARFTRGRFERPENLGSPINTERSDFDPFIAPDESYLIFASDRPGGLGNADLYISFRGKDGSWSEPRNMGAPVNSPYLDYAPMLSPDGKYLFFTSGRGGADDVYWVDARVIDTLRPGP